MTLSKLKASCPLASSDRQLSPVERLRSERTDTLGLRQVSVLSSLAKYSDIAKDSPLKAEVLTSAT